MGMLSRITGIWRNPQTVQMRKFEPLDRFYRRQTEINNLGLVTAFIINPVVVLPVLFLGYALAYSARKKTESNLFDQYLKQGGESMRRLEPVYSKKRLGVVGGVLLAGSLAAGGICLDRPYIAAAEIDTAADVDKAGKISQVEYKVPIKDRLFKDKIDFKVRASLFGKTFSLPHQVDQGDGFYLVKFTPAGEEIKIIVSSGEEILGSFDFPPKNGDF